MVSWSLCRHVSVNESAWGHARSLFRGYPYTFADQGVAGLVPCARKCIRSLHGQHSNNLSAQPHSEMGMAQGRSGRLLCGELDLVACCHKMLVITSTLFGQLHDRLGRFENLYLALWQTRILCLEPRCDVLLALLQLPRYSV